MGFLSKLLRLLLKVTKVTTGNQKMPKMGQNSIISPFFARRAKNALAEGRSPPQELEVSPRSGLYLLVFLKTKADSIPFVAHLSVFKVLLSLKRVYECEW